MKPIGNKKNLVPAVVTRVVTHLAARKQVIDKVPGLLVRRLV